MYVLKPGIITTPDTVPIHLGYMISRILLYRFYSSSGQKCRFLMRVIDEYLAVTHRNEATNLNISTRLNTKWGSNAYWLSLHLCGSLVLSQSRWDSSVLVDCEWVCLIVLLFAGVTIEVHSVTLVDFLMSLDPLRPNHAKGNAGPTRAIWSSESLSACIWIVQHNIRASEPHRLPDIFDSLWVW